MSQQSITAVSRFRNNRLGFTLIEMLVTITIMLLLVGGGLASYLQFDQRQGVITAADQVEVLLRSAQKKARVGDKPSGCDTLQGYSVDLTSGNGDINLVANCLVGGAPQDITVTTEQLRATVTAASTVSIQFNVLAGGVTGAGTVDIQKNDLRYQLEVTQGGEILNNGFVEQ